MAAAASQIMNIDTRVVENGDQSLHAVCLSIVDDVLDEVEVKVEGNRKKAEWFRVWDGLPRRTTDIPADISRRWEEPWVSSADVNDLRSQLVSRLPRCLWLQWNGDAQGECYAPFLCAHYWVGMPFDQFVELLGGRCGSDLAWGNGGSKILHKQGNGGLRRHHNYLPFASFAWMDPTGTAPSHTTSKPEAPALCGHPAFDCVLLYANSFSPFLLLNGIFR